MYALFFLTSVTYYDFYANPAKNRQICVACFKTVSDVFIKAKDANPMG